MPDLPPVVRASIRVYRLVLKAYPKAFRSEFGEEMLDVFADQLVDAMQKNGLLGIAGAWFRVSSDFCCSVCEQHTFVLKGQLAMLQSTSAKAFSTAVCTTLAIVAMTAVVVASFQARQADSLRQEALSAEATVQQSRNSGGADTPAQPISWDGTLDNFPEGATVNESQMFTFNGPDGPKTIEVPTITWQTKATRQLR